MKSRLAAALIASALAVPLVVPAARAADPATSSVTVPSSPGSSVEVTWTGTVNPGASGAATNSCDTALGPDLDEHEVTIDVPDGLYDGAVQVAFTFDITWTDDVQDLVLSVQDAGGNLVGASDGGSPQETVSVQNLPAGTYTVSACAFAAVLPTDYDGLLRITTSAFEPLPSPELAPLTFSAATTADIQRDESEPLIHVDRDGIAYTCGPTGTSQANEYAQVSTDGGDQFHLLGEPPRGQISEGGGGDCAIDTGLERNSEGFYQLAYTGLSGLITFTTATSADRGATIQASPTSQAVPVVDRQWVALSDDLTVFHAYNKLLLGVHVQRSTDGGLTYEPDELISPGAARGPGDVTAMPASLNPVGDSPVVFYPWQLGNRVMMAVTLDEGATWNNCTVYASEANPGRLFPGMDHDLEGNLYAVWTEDANDDTYISVLRNEDLADCGGGIENVDRSFEANPGWSDAILVNRAPVNTTVFPWIAAGGAPGRVAVSFFGTKDVQHPDAPNLKTWHVYVNQTLNALDVFDGGDVAFSQTQATTHPPHFDSICLGGLSCDTTNPGDRSMADFFAMDLNPSNGELMVVFNRTHKRPGDPAGQVATPTVVRQVAGPSNLGGTVDRPDRTPLRDESTDPTGDAIADYSSQTLPPTRAQIPAADVTSVRVGPAIDLASGTAATEDAGFTVTATFDDLSDAALQSALVDAKAQSLMYIFRFVDGYRYSAAVASWNAINGWSFGFNGFAGAPNECVATETIGFVAGEDGCLKYPADQPLEGAVDVETGTIRMTVPLSYLSALDDATPVPNEVPAAIGDRVYSAAMYVQANPISPVPAVQSWLEPLDNSPAFDFLIGVAADGGEPEPAPTPTPEPEPAPEPSPLPTTGGGLAIGALLALGAVTRRRR